MATKKRKAGLKKDATQQGPLHGSFRDSTVTTFIAVSLFAIFMIPLPAIGGGLLFQAVTLIKHKPSALIPLLISMSIEIGLWFVGLSFIGLWFYLIWRLGVWVPSVTVSSFILKGHRLEIKTPRHGLVRIAISDIVACKKRIAPRRGINSSGRLLGWWLRSQTIGWVYLDERTSNANVLISSIPAAISVSIQRKL